MIKLIKEKTLVLIKPDGIIRNLIGRIIMRFEDAGLKIIGMKMVWVDGEFAGKHYRKDIGEKHGERVRDGLIKYIKEGPVVAMVLEGVDAINVARKLEAVSGDRLDLEVAQFNCELAQQQLDTGGEKEARNYIKRALNIDPRCVRASILEGRLEQQSGKYKGALRAYNRVVKQDIECLPEVVESMLKCYRETGKLQEFKDYLTELVTDSSGITPVLYLTGLIDELQGTDAAVNYISAQLRKRPTVRGVDKLIDYVMPRVDGELRENLESIKEVTGRLLETHSIYKCNQCGFDALRLHWQCPSCKRWNTIKRVHGVAGE